MNPPPKRYNDYTIAIDENGLTYKEKAYSHADVRGWTAVSFSLIRTSMFGLKPWISYLVLFAIISAFDEVAGILFIAAIILIFALSFKYATYKLKIVLMNGQEYVYSQAGSIASYGQQFKDLSGACFEYFGGMNHSININ